MRSNVTDPAVQQIVRERCQKILCTRSFLAISSWESGMGVQGCMLGMLMYLIEEFGEQGTVPTHGMEGVGVTE